jgi:lipopolysaccharide/colanic/teichoic acid biosynthesis glycosyltransferase
LPRENIILTGSATIPPGIPAPHRRLSPTDDLAPFSSEGTAAVYILDGAKEKALRAVAAAFSAGIPSYVATAVVPELAAAVNSTTVGGTSFIPFPGAARRPLREAAKWLMDKAVAAGCILTFSPIWFPMFAAIKIDSRGPIVFRQKRLTKKRREFNIYKFRTMFADVPPYQQSPPGDDDIRVTRVGKLLRKLGLDETAQLVNVLKGQMSLVGPRPEMAFVAAAYAPWQNLRFAVKPGITGLWQIAGRADQPIHDNLEFDFYYVANHNLWWDIRVFLATIPILFGKGRH